MLLPPIRQGRRRASLLTATTEIPGLDPNGNWDSFWRHPQYGCGSNSGAYPACDQPGRKLEGTVSASPAFGPFWIYGVAPCASTVASTRAEREEAARDRLESSRAALIESVLWSGEATLADPAGVPTQYPVLVEGAAIPSLSSTATVLTGGGSPAPLLNVLEALTRAARQDCGLRGPLTFHAPSWGMARFHSLQLGIDRVGDRWMLGDDQIVFGEGYGDTIGGITAATGSIWVVVTGPVEVSVQNKVTVWPGETSLNAAMQNTDPVYAEQLAGYRFDTCCVLAAIAEAC